MFLERIYLIDGESIACFRISGGLSFFIRHSIGFPAGICGRLNLNFNLEKRLASFPNSYDSLEKRQG